MAGISITTIYDLGMAKYVYVQLYPGTTGAPAPPTLRIRADKIEKVDGGKMVLKIGNEIVGEFTTTPQGWWIQDE